MVSKFNINISWKRIDTEISFLITNGTVSSWKHIPLTNYSANRKATSELAESYHHIFIHHHTLQFNKTQHFVKSPDSVAFAGLPQQYCW